jgi:DnaJ family protein C protein 25
LPRNISRNLISYRYELLKDDESREEYNYILDHPEEMWRNYYSYYSRRPAPKVDVRIVIAATVSIISLIQCVNVYSRRRW